MLKTIMTGAALSFAVTAGAASAVTISETFTTPFVVDSASGTYSFNVADSLSISDINITIDFTKCDGDLSTAPVCMASGFSFNREIVFKLISPLMTVVDLVLEDTYGGQTPGDRVSVTFDDSAATVVGGATLLSGVFRPVGSLAALIGENTAGTWSIFYEDTVGSDALSFNGYSLEINGSDVAPVPLPASLPLLALGVGAVVALRRRKARA